MNMLMKTHVIAWGKTLKQTIFSSDRFLIWQNFWTWFTHKKVDGEFAVGAESVKSKYLRISLYPDLADFSTMRQKSMFRLRVDRGGHERSKIFFGCALRLPQKMGASRLVGTEHNFACAPLTSPLQGPGRHRRSRKFGRGTGDRKNFCWGAVDFSSTRTRTRTKPGPSPGAKSQREGKSLPLA